MNSLLLQVLTKHQRNKSGEPQEGEEGKVVLFERQTPKTLYLQVKHP